MKVLLPKFDPTHIPSEDSPECLAFAKQLFQMFDAQGSEGISRNEIPPAGGEALDQIDNDLLEFKVPVNYVYKTLNPLSISANPLRDDPKKTQNPPGKGLFEGNHRSKKIMINHRSKKII